MINREINLLKNDSWEELNRRLPSQREYVFINLSQIYKNWKVFGKFFFQKWQL